MGPWAAKSPTYIFYWSLKKITGWAHLSYSRYIFKIQDFDSFVQNIDRLWFELISEWSYVWICSNMLQAIKTYQLLCYHQKYDKSWHLHIFEDCMWCWHYLKKIINGASSILKALNQNLFLLWWTWSPGSDTEHVTLISNSLAAALFYLEQLQGALAPRSLKSHVVTPFGTSFLGVESDGGFGLRGTNRSMRAAAPLESPHFGDKRTKQSRQTW